MGVPDRGTVTRLLNAGKSGDTAAREELYRHVYDELLKIAKKRLRGEPKLTGKAPESLVHEVYLKFAGNSPEQWLDRKQFYGYTRRAMWQICVDQIRRNEPRAAEHLSDWMVELPLTDSTGIGDLAAALKKLREINERVVEVVSMRFIEGQSVKETAELLGVGDRTVESDWAFGRAWLHRELKGGTTSSGSGRAAS